MDGSVVSQTDSSIQLNYKDVERETDEQSVNSSEIKSQEYQIVKPSDSGMKSNIPLLNQLIFDLHCPFGRLMKREFISTISNLPLLAT